MKKSLRITMAQNLIATRAVVTARIIRLWFKEINNYFVKFGIIVNKPERIFNADEELGNRHTTTEQKMR